MLPGCPLRSPGRRPGGTAWPGRMTSAVAEEGAFRAGAVPFRHCAGIYGPCSGAVMRLSTSKALLCTVLRSVQKLSSHLAWFPGFSRCEVIRGSLGDRHAATLVTAVFPDCLRVHMQITAVFPDCLRAHMQS